MLCVGAMGSFLNLDSYNFLLYFIRNTNDPLKRQLSMPLKTRFSQVANRQEATRERRQFVLRVRVTRAVQGTPVFYIRRIT